MTTGLGGLILAVVNPDPQSSTLGELIQFHRTVRGWNQRELAARVGVTQNAVWRWEGDKARPTVGHLKELSVALDLSMVLLLSKTEVAA